MSKAPSPPPATPNIGLPEHRGTPNQGATMIPIGAVCGIVALIIVLAILL